MAKLDQPSFSSGEISGRFASRRDTAKYLTGLRRARNMLLMTSGAAFTRPGTEFVAEVQDSAEITTLIPFQATPSQGYALEFGDERIRFHYDGAPVLLPALTIVAISQANPAVVQAIANGYAVGRVVYFTGVLGMTQINGRTAKIIAILNANEFTIDLDTTDFSAFTGDTGGVAGNASGSVGGLPPPPDPAVDPVPIVVDAEPPPRTIPKGDWYFDDNGNYIPPDA